MRNICLEPYESRKAAGKDAAGDYTGRDHAGRGEDTPWEAFVGTGPCQRRTSGETDAVFQSERTVGRTGRDQRRL